MSLWDMLYGKDSVYVNEYAAVERRLPIISKAYLDVFAGNMYLLFEKEHIWNIRRKQSRRSTQLLNARINYRWKITKSEWLVNKNWEKVWKKHQGSVPKKAMTKKEFKKWQEELLTKTK